MLTERGIAVLRLEYTTTKSGLQAHLEAIKKFVLGE